MIEFIAHTAVHIIGVLTVLLAVMTSGHAILHKRDARAAVGWVGLIWLVPVFGAILYVLLGVNRIRRRAIELRRTRLRLVATTEELPYLHQGLEELLPAESRYLTALALLVDRVTRLPLTRGNRIVPLVNGDAAYPAMLEAIEGARRTLALCTYIFDNDDVGVRFVDALHRARARGVEVRVLVDALGARYSVPTIVRTLQRRGVRVARFLHSALPWRMPYMNLRSHRKILVADGRTGFTGGMNIRRGHLLANHPRRPIQDLHFQVDGPVVTQLMHVFAEDWAFTTGEALEGEGWFPAIDQAGGVAARGIPDGPDEDHDQLRWTVLGALARAERQVRIVTPYFLPDQSLITALSVAAMRGVEVDIVLPSNNNLPYVHWAAVAQLWQLLEPGCRVYFTRPPFDHTKLMVVDGHWSLIGSANWDPRSLRLNFEFDLECYGVELANSLCGLVDQKLEGANRITMEDLDGRSLAVKLRDGVARLFAPYL